MSPECSMRVARLLQRARGTATAVSEGNTAAAVEKGASVMEVVSEGITATAVVDEENTTNTVVEKMSEATPRLSLLVLQLSFLHPNLAMDEIEE